MITHLRDGYHRARKPHTCSLCHAAIQPGDRYYAAVCIYDDHMYTWRECGPCNEAGIASHVYDFWDCPDEGIDAEDAYEWATTLLADDPNSDDAQAARAYLDRRHHD